MNAVTAQQESRSAGRVASGIGAATAMLVASDDANATAGAVIPVDEGLTVHTGQPDRRDRMAPVS